MGIDSSAPTGPISQTQKKNMVNTSHVVSDSARPVMVGSRTFSASDVEGGPADDDDRRRDSPDSAKARIVGGTSATTRPMYGTKREQERADGPQERIVDADDQHQHEQGRQP